jgi:atypical dual specificity phosphatase
MADFNWIVEKEVGGMSHPYSPEDFHFLKESAIDVIVSLTGSGPDRELAERFRMRVHHFHIPDMDIPSIATMDSIADAIDTELKEGRRVAVHCGAGLGRTGTVLACYLVSRGEPADTAIATVRRKRPGSIETLDQERFVSDYEEHIKRRRKKNRDKRRRKKNR